MKLIPTSPCARWAFPAAIVLMTAISIPSGASIAAHHHGTGAGATHSTHQGRDQDGGPKPQGSVPPYLHQVANVTFPAPFAASTSYDISFVDPTTHTYYLADRTNSGVDAVSTATDTFGGVIGAGDFAGATPTVTPAQTAACGHSEAGPNGVLSLSVGGTNQVWAADGVTAANPVSNVKVFTMSSGTAGTLSATIPTGNSTFGTAGTCRADEMAYDPTDNLVIVANDVDSPPYLSLISVNANPASDAVVAQIKFPNATGGIEQSVFDPQTDLFYTNIPGVELAVINPTTKSLETTYDQPNCVSSGLTLDPANQQLLVSCGINPFGSMLMDVHSGAVIARFPQVSGADEIWFDSGTNNYYLGANHMTSDGNTDGFPTPVIGVIWAGGPGKHLGLGHARANWADKVKAQWTSNFATGATTTNTHSVAADPGNGQVFVPVAGYGIAVLADTSASTGL